MNPGNEMHKRTFVFRLDPPPPPENLFVFARFLGTPSLPLRANVLFEWSLIIPLARDIGPKTRSGPVWKSTLEVYFHSVKGCNGCLTATITSLLHSVDIR